MELKVVRIRECTSTQEVARNLAEGGAAEGTVVIADRMTSGRGRLNRLWVADEGGLWFTIILRPRSTTNLQLITLIAGISVVEGVRKLYDVPLELKWPNDVLLRGRKLCGILTEAKFSNNAIEYILLGIGVNINNELRGDLKRVAISLKEYLKFEVPVDKVFIETMKGFNDLYELLMRGCANDIIMRWRKYSATLGKHVRVSTTEDVIEGLAVDVDADGSLIIDTGKDVVKVYSGDVVHLRFE